MAALETLPEFVPTSRAEWRDWLRENHLTARGVWLVYFKVRAGVPSVAYIDAVKEALCFGWIDSKVQSLDENRYRQVFTPRKPKSVWSAINKGYLEELFAAGLMEPAGIRAVEVGKENGSWVRLTISESLETPDDLLAALNPAALANFERFPPGSRKNILFFIHDAKTPETRARRIAETARMAALNQRIR